MIFGFMAFRAIEMGEMTFRKKKINPPKISSDSCNIAIFLTGDFLRGRFFQKVISTISMMACTGTKP
jgi:hypothetical protein